MCQLYAAEAHMKLGHINESVIMLDPKKVHHFQDVSFSDTVANNGNNNGGGNGSNQENQDQGVQVDSKQLLKSCSK